MLSTDCSMHAGRAQGEQKAVGRECRLAHLHASLLQLLHLLLRKCRGLLQAVHLVLQCLAGHLCSSMVHVQARDKLGLQQETGAHHTRHVHVSTSWYNVSAQGQHSCVLCAGPLLQHRLCQ
jgi:hypothetical protein